MAYHYVAPLADMRFVLEHVLAAPASWARCAAFAELDIDTAAAVLGEAGRFAGEVLQPLNAAGDREGCRIDAEGQVRTPEGFAAAYQAFVDAGWPALPCDAAWGGQGLPLALDAALREMLSACNHGWSMYPDLLHGAYETVKAHGSEALKDRYLREIATGRTLAAMALTEPQAGSDLGALRTKAEPQPDGSLRISGSKIFISGADHDLTHDVVHLVLCRLPDSPAGSKGLSLALVPKWLPQGERNAWVVDSLEHKMGIHGSATCALRYEGATGWLVGEPHRGLAAMFLMMNSARLHVGLQGLGHQEMATQNALRQVFERRQFKMPLAHMPAMRHLVLRLQAKTEAQRVIAYRAALAIDEMHHHEDEAVRRRAGGLAALLTPVVKAFCTHHGFHGAAAAQQAFGGYGYTREVGIEQTVRDARIAMVYEGTNEIQAIDLLQRKVLADGGGALEDWLVECEAEATCAEAAAAPFVPSATRAPHAAPAWPEGAEFAAALRAQIGRAREATASVAAAARNDADAPLRVADDYLFGVGHLLLAWAFTASARAAAGQADQPFAAAKLERMRYGLRHVLPQAEVHWRRVLDVHLSLPALRAP
ncbi:MAG: acyl-CoA dehydrogenase [Rubrivivax sp.]|nr:acyl-CoA dehydrogenase [Rubrivivax sp.]